MEWQMSDLGWDRRVGGGGGGRGSWFLVSIIAPHQQSDAGQVTLPKGLLILSHDTPRVVPPYATDDICQTVSFPFCVLTCNRQVLFPRVAEMLL